VRSDSRSGWCDGFCFVGADERITVGILLNDLLQDTKRNVYAPLEGIGGGVNRGVLVVL